MTDPLHQLNVSMVNEIVGLVNTATDHLHAASPAAALSLLDAALDKVTRLPIVEPSDSHLHPQILLSRTEALLDLSQTSAARTSLEGAHKLIEQVVGRSEGSPDLEQSASRLTSNLAMLASAVDSGAFSLACLELDCRQAARCASMFPTDPDVQARYLSAFGRIAEVVAERNPAASVEMLNSGLPVAKWLARSAPDDVANLCIASAFVAQYAFLKAGYGQLTQPDSALLDEFIRVLDQLQGRGRASEQAASLRAIAEVVELAMSRNEPLIRPTKPGLLSEPPPDGPALVGRRTLTGKPQAVPEALGRVDRRTRLYERTKQIIATLPAAQADAIGRPLGDGAAMEELVAAITPVFGSERSLLRWVALWEALRVMDQLGQAVGLEAFPAMVGLEFFTDHRTDTVGYRFWESHPSMSPQVQNACINLCSAVVSRAVMYDEISNMSVDEVNSNADFVTIGILNDTMAIEFIAWVATAQLRLEAALGAPFAIPDLPEPSLLEEPGWYVEPLFSNGERYWDGADWTPWVRTKVEGRYVTAPVALR